MKHTASFSQRADDTARAWGPDDLSPRPDDEQPVSPRKWLTPWHNHVAPGGTLAGSGRIRVTLRDEQFMIERHNKRWIAISFHRDCESVIRVLGEKSRMKANAHLATDYLEVQRKLEQL